MIPLVFRRYRRDSSVAGSFRMTVIPTLVDKSELHRLTVKACQQPGAGGRELEGNDLPVERW